MNDRELMKMALDALELFESGTNGLYKGKFKKERKALRERLSQWEALDRMVAENQSMGLYEEAPCKFHPDAPHGFDRNASHSEDRYVCECEYWEPPPEREWVGLTDDEVMAIYVDTMAYDAVRVAEAKQQTTLYR